MSKIGVKYGMNREEYCMEYFDYEHPLHFWTFEFVSPPMNNFELVVSVQIMSVFDVNGECVSDWTKCAML